MSWCKDQQQNYELCLMLHTVISLDLNYSYFYKLSIVMARSSLLPQRIVRWQINFILMNHETMNTQKVNAKRGSNLFYRLRLEDTVVIFSSRWSFSSCWKKEFFFIKMAKILILFSLLFVSVHCEMSAVSKFSINQNFHLKMIGILALGNGKENSWDE